MKQIYPLPIACLIACVALSACTDKPGTPPAGVSDDPVLSIPIQRDEHWIANATTVDGKPIRLMLDTGVTFAALADKGSAAAMPFTSEARSNLIKQGVLSSNFPEDGVVTLQTASDTKEAKIGLTPELRIQKWVMAAGQPVFQDDIEKINALSGGERIDGIVGIEAMRNLTWRADYTTGQLSAYDGKPPAHDWQQCTFMAFDVNQNRVPVVELALGNQVSHVGIDTGDTGDIAITQDGFEGMSNSHMFESYGVVYSFDATHRLIPQRTGLLPGISVGHKALPKLVVTGNAPADRVGLGLLSKMDRVELDFRHYRLCFDLPATPRDSTVGVVGAAIVKSDNHYVVLAVAPNGRLEASGVKEGDWIMMVDQQTAAALDSKALYKVLNDPQTREVTIRRANQSLSLKLKHMD